MPTKAILTVKTAAMCIAFCVHPPPPIPIVLLAQTNLRDCTKWQHVTKVRCYSSGTKKPENGKQHAWPWFQPKWGSSGACGVKNVYMQGYIYASTAWCVMLGVKCTYTIQTLHAFQRQAWWWQGLLQWAIFQKSDDTKCQRWDWSTPLLVIKCEQLLFIMPSCYCSMMA